MSNAKSSFMIIHQQYENFEKLINGQTMFNLSTDEALLFQDVLNLLVERGYLGKCELSNGCFYKVLGSLTDFKEWISLFFNKMTPADKQLLLRSLVTEIQIFPEKTEDGRIVKCIKLYVPVVYENDKTPKISWDKLTPVESIVCLIRE